MSRPGMDIWECHVCGGYGVGGPQALESHVELDGGHIVAVHRDLTRLARKALRRLREFEFTYERTIVQRAEVKDFDLVERKDGDDD